jgi:hypothetical protein
MMAATGITKGCSTFVATLTPSTALNTEIAGVITPSPYSKAAPEQSHCRQDLRAVTQAVCSYQRHERHDSAGSMVVRPHDKHTVLHRHGDDQRPEDQ